MSAIAVPAFGLLWWLACFLFGRGLGRAGAALAAYAIAVAAWTIDPAGTVTGVLWCLPALIWAGVVIGLLPRDLPERQLFERGWWLVSVVFLALVIVLPGPARLVALIPPAGGLTLLWRSGHDVRPRSLRPAVTVVAALYAAGLIATLAHLDLGAPVVVLLAMGLDLMVLGYLVAVADAVETGERLRPDLRRSAVTALVATLLVAGPAALSTLAAPDVPALIGLQFVLVAVVLGAAGLAGPMGRGLDRLAFLHDDRLRSERSALLMLAEALPRRRERHRLIATSEEEFARLTRRALENFGDIEVLLRSPLIDLPTVDRRLTGSMAEQPLARALELRAVLRESVARLKPDGLFGTTEVWRHYNALYYCCVLGLRPYRRLPHTDGLDRDARRANDWFRRHVPRRTVRLWVREGSHLVAGRLWDELVSTDPRWLTHAAVTKRTSTTRST